jgi:hypothetical protein
MLNVVILSVTNKPFMLSVFMLNVVMLSVVMLNVMAPSKGFHSNGKMLASQKNIVLEWK